MKRSWSPSMMTSPSIMVVLLIIFLSSITLSGCLRPSNDGLSPQAREALGKENPDLAGDDLGFLESSTEEQSVQPQAVPPYVPLNTKKSTESTMNTDQLPQDVTELQGQILKEGTGGEVKPGDTITVHYTGRLLNNEVFDSSLNRNQPFSFTVGAGMVIEGWERGTIGMKVGEQRRLFIPSEMGYGEQGAPPVIPPNADLVFDIELLKITPGQTGN